MLSQKKNEKRSLYYFSFRFCIVFLFASSTSSYAQKVTKPIWNSNSAYSQAMFFLSLLLLLLSSSITIKSFPLGSLCFWGRSKAVGARHNKKSRDIKREINDFNNKTQKQPVNLNREKWRDFLYILEGAEHFACFYVSPPHKQSSLSLYLKCASTNNNVYFLLAGGHKTVTNREWHVKRMVAVWHKNKNNNDELKLPILLLHTQTNENSFFLLSITSIALLVLLLCFILLKRLRF